MRVSVLAATLALSSAALLSASDASAQQISASDVMPSSSPPPTIAPTEAQGRALHHYERGRAYYAVGRYRSAISELETAIRLDPAGFNLYFDLGLVYERVGDAEHALAAYRHYLEHVSDPAERERAERIVSRVQGARIEIQDMQARRGRADAWFWGTATASLATLVTGSALLIAGATEANPQTAGTLNVVGGTGLALGAGLGVTAALLYFLREAPPRYAPRCITAGVDAHGGAHVGLTLAF